MKDIVGNQGYINIACTLFSTFILLIKLWVVVTLRSYFLDIFIIHPVNFVKVLVDLRQGRREFDQVAAAHTFAVLGAEGSMK